MDRRYCIPSSLFPQPFEAITAVVVPSPVLVPLLLLGVLVIAGAQAWLHHDGAGRRSCSQQGRAALTAHRAGALVGCSLQRKHAVGSPNAKLHTYE